jgi:transglutaminase-like putative cysteine protease
VCQDFSHIMIAALRGLGLPAAYVSGYLRTLPPPDRRHVGVVAAAGDHDMVVPDADAVGRIEADPALPAPDHVVPEDEIA